MFYSLTLDILLHYREKSNLTVKSFSCPLSNTTTYTLFSPPFVQLPVSSSAIEEMSLILFKANLFSFGCAGSPLL